MSDNKHEGYNELMMELYKENQNFLNKAIFGISTLAIPFLFNTLSANEQSFTVSVLLVISLILFLGVIFFQILSLKSARDGCDKSLEITESSVEDGEVLFNKARALDVWREWLFIGGICVIIISMCVGIIEKEIKMSKNNGKEIQNSFTPPKASINEQQRSFVPPKASVSQNKPNSATSGTAQGNTSAQSTSNGTTNNQTGKK